MLLRLNLCSSVAPFHREIHRCTKAMMSTVTWWHRHASAHGWRRWMLQSHLRAVEGAASWHIWTYTSKYPCFHLQVDARDGQHSVCFCCFWMLLKYVWSWLETDACDNEIQILNPAEWRGNLHKMPSASSKCIKSWACLVTCDMTKTNTCLLWFTVMHEAPCIHSMSLVPPSILDLNVTRDRFTSQVGVWEKCICSICIFQMWSMPKTGCLVCRWTST